MRERQIPYDVTYMWNLKYDINELIHETNRLTENRLGRGGAGGGMEWMLGLADVSFYIQNG